MIGSTLSRVQTAEKLSIPQLQQAIQSGTIPAYMGVPLLEEKIQFEQRMRSAAAARMAQGQQPTIAEQVMDQAQMVEGDGGIDQIPIETPEFAGGGIVAFSNGGETFTPSQRGFLGTMFGPSAGLISREEVVNELDPEELREFNRTGKLPVRLMKIVGDRSIAAPSGTKDQGIAAAAPIAPPPVAPPAAAPGADLRAPVQMVGGRPVPIDRSTGEELGIAPPMDERPMPQQQTTGDLLGRTDALFNQLYGTTAPTAPSDRESYIGRTEDFFKKAGVNLELAAQQAADIAKEKESLSKDKTEAANFRLLEAGLAIMGGTSPFAFENIGKGASKAMQGYVQDIKDLKKAEKDLNAATRQLTVTQNQMRMGVAQTSASDYAEDVKRHDAALRRREDAKAELAKALMADERSREIVKAQMRPSQYEMARADALSGDPKRQAFAETYLGATKTGKLTTLGLEKEYNDLKIVDKKKLEKQGIYNAADYVRSRMAEQGGMPGAASQGKVIDFNSIR